MIKFKTIEGGKAPIKLNLADAGYDCYARDIEIVRTKKGKIKLIKYKLGFSMEMPEDYSCLLFCRSSIIKYDLFLCNSVGVIDSGYRSELIAVFKPTKKKNPVIYEIGERVCQIIPYKLPNINFEIVEDLNYDNDRGGGFGSTGQ